MRRVSIYTYEAKCWKGNQASPIRDLVHKCYMKYSTLHAVILIENIEIVSLASVWMLEPRLPELLLELKKVELYCS